MWHSERNRWRDKLTRVTRCARELGAPSCKRRGALSLSRSSLPLRHCSSRLSPSLAHCLRDHHRSIFPALCCPLLHCLNPRFLVARTRRLSCCLHTIAICSDLLLSLQTRLDETARQRMQILSSILSVQGSVGCACSAASSSSMLGSRSACGSALASSLHVGIVVQGLAHRPLTAVTMVRIHAVPRCASLFVAIHRRKVAHAADRSAVEQSAAKFEKSVPHRIRRTSRELKSLRIR